MTWTETRRRQQVLREVKAIASERQDGVLPWTDDYADAFTGPDDLLRELAYIWRIHVEAQIDTNLDEASLDDRWDSLHHRYAGVRRILEANTSPIQKAHELAA